MNIMRVPEEFCETALFKAGDLVAYDQYPKRIFKVCNRGHNYSGKVFYVLEDMNGRCGHSDVAQKHLSPID